MICSGNLKPGMQPPSENEIIDKYNVSNITFTNQRSNLAFILGRQGLQCIRVSFLNGFIIHFTPFTYSRPNASNSIGRVCSSVMLIGYFHPHLGKDAIVPFNVHLERALVPQENDIMEVVRKVLHL